jgi:hypothetical protein
MYERLIYNAVAVADSGDSIVDHYCPAVDHLAGGCPASGIDRPSPSAWSASSEPEPLAALAVLRVLCPFIPRHIMSTKRWVIWCDIRIMLTKGYIVPF